MRKTSKILILILLLIPIRINALEGNIKLNCSPSIAKPNETINCAVIATSDELINGIRADISLTDNLEYVDFKPNTNWQGDGTNNQIGLYTSTNVKGTQNLGILTIKVKDNVFNKEETISLKNCLFSDENFKKVNVSGDSVQIRIPSSNNKLSSLEVNPGTIEFSPEKLNYDIKVDESTININATKEDDKSTISGDVGQIDLKYGINSLKVYVTSESGEIRTYTLNVTRNDNRSQENKLSSLTIDNYKIDFKESTYTYNLTVDYETEQIKIGAKLKDSKSYFVKGYEPGTKKLEEGLNKIEIKVYAENGNIKTYTLNITRKEDPNNTSDDNYLEEINIENNKIDFNKEQKDYKLTVDYNTNNLNINTITSSNKSKVEITGNDNLKVGENIVTIKVTSKNGEIREYKIVVTKKDKDVILSNNNYLKSLEIENYKIKFDKNTLTYEIKIKDEETLNIIALPEDENANITIKGNKELKNKSIIKITVSAENGETKEYSINIKKKLQIDFLLLTVIIESFIILGIIIYFIIKNQRNRKREYQTIEKKTEEI